MRFLVVASVLALSIWPSTVEGDGREYVLLFMNNDPVEHKSPGEPGHTVEDKSPGEPGHAVEDKSSGEPGHTVEDKIPGEPGHTVGVISPGQPGYGHFAKVHLVSSNDDGRDFDEADWTDAIFNVPVDLSNSISSETELISYPVSRDAKNPRSFTVTKLVYAPSYPQSVYTEVEPFQIRKFFFKALLELRVGFDIEKAQDPRVIDSPSDNFGGYYLLHTDDATVQDIYKLFFSYKGSSKGQLRDDTWKTKEEWGSLLAKQSVGEQVSKFIDIEIFTRKSPWSKEEFPMEECPESGRIQFRVTILGSQRNSELALCSSEEDLKEKQETGPICNWSELEGFFVYRARRTEKNNLLSYSTTLLAGSSVEAVRSFLSYAVQRPLQQVTDRPESYSAPVKAMKNPTKKKNKKKKNMKKKRGRRNRKRFH